MKSNSYSGAYSRRFSNYTASDKTSRGTGTYSLSVVSADPSMGTVGYIELVPISPFSSATQAQQVSVRGGQASGKHFRAVAKAEPGCHFVQWKTNIDGVGNTDQNPIEFALTKDTSLVACFAKDFAGSPDNNKVANVSWDSKMGSVNGDGLVLSSEARASSGQLAAAQGSTVSLTASPLAGYKFVAWHGAPVEGKTSKTVSFQMNANYAIRAEFASEKQSTGGGGTGGGGTDPETPSVVSPAGTGFGLMSFVKKWWWAILIVAYIVYKDRKGGSK